MISYCLTPSSPPTRPPFSNGGPWVDFPNTAAKMLKFKDWKIFIYLTCHILIIKMTSSGVMIECTSPGMCWTSPRSRSWVLFTCPLQSAVTNTLIIEFLWVVSIMSWSEEEGSTVRLETVFENIWWQWPICTPCGISASANHSISHRVLARCSEGHCVWSIGTRIAEQSPKAHW